jgi:DNA-binding response OmpR family regulator
LPAEAARPLVLVVEDDPRALRLMTVVLGHAGYRVQAAGTPEAAQAMLEQEVPDVVATDLYLPGMSGIEFCLWVRARLGAHAPAMMLLTAMDTAETRRSAAAAGIDDVMTKPFDIGELKQRLARLIRGTRTH